MESGFRKQHGRQRESTKGTGERRTEGSRGGGRTRWAGPTQIQDQEGHREVARDAGTGLQAQEVYGGCDAHPSGCSRTRLLRSTGQRWRAHGRVRVLRLDLAHTLYWKNTEINKPEFKETQQHYGCLRILVIYTGMFLDEMT